MFSDYMRYPCPLHREEYCVVGLFCRRSVHWAVWCWLDVAPDAPPLYRLVLGPDSLLAVATPVDITASHQMSGRVIPFMATHFVTIVWVDAGASPWQVDYRSLDRDRCYVRYRLSNVCFPLGWSDALSNHVLMPGLRPSINV